MMLSFSCGPLDTTPAPFPVVKKEIPYNIPNSEYSKKITPLKCDEGTFLTYENFGEEFFLNHCTSCHSSDLSDESARSGAPATINLDTPENIQLFRANILSVTRAYLQEIDGVEDEEEDSDGDGIPDREEDSDGDGIPDVNEDENGNGIPDVSENENEEDVSLPQIMMPPSGILPIPALRNLKEYLECGAPAGRDKIN